MLHKMQAKVILSAFVLLWQIVSGSPLASLSSSTSPPNKILATRYSPETSPHEPRHAFHKTTLSRRTLTPCVPVPAGNCNIYSSFANSTASGDVMVYDDTCTLVETNVTNIPVNNGSMYASDLPYPIYLRFNPDGALSFHYHDGAWTTNITTECETDYANASSVVCRKEFLCPSPSP